MELDSYQTTTMVYALLTISCGMMVGCTALTPSEFLARFPQKTEAAYYNRLEGEEAVKSGACEVLVEDRTYNAPIRASLNKEMTKGAQGIDEWVYADGGNAYILNNYEWKAVGNEGGT